MRNSRSINNLIEFMEVAINLDDKFYKKKIERNPKSGKQY